MPGVSGPGSAVSQVPGGSLVQPSTDTPVPTVRPTAVSMMKLVRLHNFHPSSAWARAGRASAVTVTITRTAILRNKRSSAMLCKQLH